MQTDHLAAIHDVGGKPYSSVLSARVRSEQLHAR